MGRVSFRARANDDVLSAFISSLSLTAAFISWFLLLPFHSLARSSHFLFPTISLAQSCVPLQTATGSMEGRFTLRSKSGIMWEASVPCFRLEPPSLVDMEEASE